MQIRTKAGSRGGDIHAVVFFNIGYEHAQQIVSNVFKWYACSLFQKYLFS